MVLNDIQNAYVGSAPVSAIYLGDTLIWPQTPTVTYEVLSIDPAPSVRWWETSANITFDVRITTRIAGQEPIIDEHTESHQVTFDKNWPTPKPSYLTSLDYVDLGLPSGLLWAKCNIGATQEYQKGLYFQWGDVEGYQDPTVLNNPITRTGTFQWYGNTINWTVNQGSYSNAYTWEYYKYFDMDTHEFTKYIADLAVQNILDSTDDAAQVIMLGSTFRMPTYTEIRELWNNTTHSTETISGITGMKFTSTVYPNRYIFLPYSGMAYSNAISGDNTEGYYWTSELYEGGISEDAYGLILDGTSQLGPTPGALRTYGYNIRAVKDANN